MKRFSLIVVALFLAASCLPKPDGCEPFAHSCNGQTPVVCSAQQYWSSLPGSQPCDRIGNGALVCCMTRSPASGRIVAGCAMPQDCISYPQTDAGTPDASDASAD